MKLVFGDIVVVDGNQVGVVVRTWADTREPKVDVYVRSYQQVRAYSVDQVERHQVRSKILDGDDLVAQQIAESRP